MHVLLITQYFHPETGAAASKRLRHVETRHDLRRRRNERVFS